MTEKENKESSRQYYWFRITCIVISVFLNGLLNTILGFGAFLLIMIIVGGIFVCGIIPICFIPCYIINSILENFFFRREIKENLSDKQDDICEFVLLYIFPLIFLSGFIFDIYPNLVENGGDWECYDKTTIDYNRQNDMKCVNENGDIKRTDYEGARKLMGK